ncbi:MAG TPA: hypothetical protein VIF88_08225 [Methylocystis sp.]
MSAKTHDATRRAVIAGLAAAPVAGLPALADAAVSTPLIEAMQRQASAWADWMNAGDDFAMDAANGPADSALWELAETPCATDADFFAKIRQMLACHDSLHGEDADATECPAILAAIRLHLG